MERTASCRALHRAAHCTVQNTAPCSALYRAAHCIVQRTASCSALHRAAHCTVQCTASCKMDQRLNICYKISLQHSAFAFGLAQSPRITSLLTSAFLTIEKYDISFQNPVSPETFHLLPKLFMRRPCGHRSMYVCTICDCLLNNI